MSSVLKRQVKRHKYHAVALLLTLVPVTFNACSQLGSPFEALQFENDQRASNSDDPKALIELAFAESLYPALKSNCMGCHGLFQDPKFASGSASASLASVVGFKTTTGQPVINLISPSESRLVSQMLSGHQGFSPSLGQEFIEKIRSFANRLSQIGLLNEAVAYLNGTQDESIDLTFVPQSHLSALAKIKTVLHGGALSSDEVEWSLTANGLSVEQRKEDIKSFVRDWISTPEGKLKIRDFLKVSMQLTGDLDPDRTALIGTNMPSSLTSNLVESGMLSANRIIEQGRPFHEIVTSPSFVVSTATLTAMAFMDNRRFATGATRVSVVNDQFRAHVRDNLVAADYTDWRVVTFTQAPDNESPPSYADISHWRSVPDGGTVSFAIPRIGFMTSPGFLIHWMTNPDNQFRVTVNQALIIALNESFSLADPTPTPRQIASQDSAHAEPGTACFQCHRLMDPMREVFFSVFNTDYRFENKLPTLATPQMSFYGMQRQIPTLQAFARALSEHEKFSTGWTQKLCQYLNSQKCDESDPEFLRVASAFRASNHNFGVLVEEIASSNLITGTQASVMYQKVPFVVSTSRRNHFCAALNVRERNLRQSAGLSNDTVPLDGGEVACNARNSGGSAGVIAADSVSRGEPGLIQSNEINPFQIRAANRICRSFAGRYSNTLPSGPSGIDGSIHAILEAVQGLTPSHSRGPAAFEAYKDLYEAIRAIPEVGGPQTRERRALFEILAASCMSPELLGIGI